MRTCASYLWLAGSILTTVWVLAQNPPVPSPARITANIQPVSVEYPPSPVDDFRKLLSADEAARQRYLANKPAEKRRILEAKFQEYAALPVEERELRLQVLQLRLYLLPLMGIPKVDRTVRLATIPQPYRRLVEQRLLEWDLLPPPLQKEFLDNDTARQYFLRLRTSRPSERSQILATMEPQLRQRLEERLSGWQDLSLSQWNKMCAGFNRFFELPEEEQQKTLELLSESERQQMEQTLQTFQKLPPAQRQQCIISFRKFARLTPAERDRFLTNAERWRSMTPSERQTWRDLVTALPPLPPGVEPGFLPPPLPSE